MFLFRKLRELSSSSQKLETISQAPPPAFSFLPTTVSLITEDPTRRKNKEKKKLQIASPKSKAGPEFFFSRKDVRKWQILSGGPRAGLAAATSAFCPALQVALTAPLLSVCLPGVPLLWLEGAGFALRLSQHPSRPRYISQKGTERKERRPCSVWPLEGDVGIYWPCRPLHHPRVQAM